MIIRFTAAQLRELADQVDAMPGRAWAHLVPLNTVLDVDGKPMAYAHWWEDGNQFVAELISFTPGDAVPLAYHEDEAPGCEG